MERFKNVLEGLIVALALTACFFIFAKIIKFIFKKDIGSPNFYYASMIIGFLLHRVLITVLISK